MLLDPYPAPRWVRAVAAVDSAVERWLKAPTPRWLRWLDRLEDRVPVWALPWLLCGLMGGATILPCVVARTVTRLRRPAAAPTTA